ncbi:hypothetical protein PCANC_24060 [Puccinia coronata f. sp. avenae]|uniref:Uncharacterized protein n=1 Tax=Puccinia coronata f. sp. avenae TaxID=200324 RepID=A0A2N5SC10_9BASI|nr:hypothetical protein PCANC_24060 [Puccinia coronata f. sp. avenae]
MKRGGNDPNPLWKDPNHLTNPQLRSHLTAFAVRFDQVECRTQLFRRYVRLARIKSPESVECWTGQDSLNGPLPPADVLLVPQIKIFLALNAVNYPAQARRGHLIQLYQSLRPASPAPKVTVRVVIPPHPEHKKRKVKSKATSNTHAPKPLPKSNVARDKPLPMSNAPRGEQLPKSNAPRDIIPSHAGKSKRTTKSANRKENFFSPYERLAPQVSGEEARNPESSTARLARHSAQRTQSRSSVSSAGRSVSRASRSSDGDSLRRSSRLSAVREARSLSQASQSSEVPMASQSSKVPSTVEDDSDDDNESDNDTDMSTRDEQEARSFPKASTSRQATDSEQRAPPSSSSSPAWRSLTDDTTQSSDGDSLRRSSRVRAACEARSLSQSSEAPININRHSAMDSDLSTRDEQESRFVAEASTSRQAQLFARGTPCPSSESSAGHARTSQSSHGESLRQLFQLAGQEETSRSSRKAPAIEAHSDDNTNMATRPVPGGHHEPTDRLSSVGPKEESDAESDWRVSRVAPRRSVSPPESPTDCLSSVVPKEESHSESDWGVSRVAPTRSVSPTQSSSSNLTAIPSQPAAARSHDGEPIPESQEDRAECSVDACSQESRESLSQLESPIRAPSSGEFGEEAGQSPGDAFPPRESSVSDSDESSPAAPEQRSSDEPPAQSDAESDCGVSQVAPRRSVSPTQSSLSNLTAVPSQPAAARSHDAKPIRESQEDRAECSVDARSQESCESLSQLESPIRAPSSGEVGEEAGQSPGDAFPPQESSVSDSDESSPAAPEQRSSDETPAQSATTGLKSNRPVIVPEDVPKSSSETSDSSSVSADKPSGKQSRRAPRSIAEPSQHSTQDAPQRRTISKRKPVASEWPDASELTRPQIEQYLAAHNVPFSPSTRHARVIGSYNTLRSSLPDLGKQRPSKRPRVPRATSSGRSVRTRRKRNPTGTREVVTRATSSQTSMSTRSTTRNTSRDFPTENARGKRAKKDSRPSQSVKKAGKCKAQPPKESRSRWTRANCNHNTDDINFVPVLPQTKNKRKNVPSSSSVRAKQTCPGSDNDKVLPAHREASTTRRRIQTRARSNSYAPSTSIHVNGRVSPDDIQQATDGLSQHSRRRPSAEPSSPVRSRPTRSLSQPSPPNPSTSCVPSTSRAPFTSCVPSTSRVPSTTCIPSTSRVPSTSYVPSTSRVLSTSCVPSPSHVPSTSCVPSTSRVPSASRALSTSHGQCPNHGAPTLSRTLASSSHDHGLPQPDRTQMAEPSSRAAPARKRHKPHHSSPSPERVKRRSRSSPRLIPTSAQSRRGKQRPQRVCHKSYRGPSIQDDVIPSPPTSANRVEPWRSSLPPDWSTPPDSPPAPAHARSSKAPGAGSSCVNNQLLAEFAQVTGRLANSIDNLTLALLQPITSRAQTSKAGPSGPRDLSLLARVRQHVMTLFGKTMDSKVFPPPATEREKAKWKSDSENDYLDDNGEAMCSPSSVSLGDSDNPAFPYGDGPVHRDASAATLKIMWRSMQRCGVVSFRPDFSRAASDTDNAFLWDLAHSIFIKLVKAQEYPEIDLETPTVRQAIAPNTTMSILRENVVKCVLSGDAETEAGDDDDDNDADDQTNKRVIVSSLPWRHPQIGRAFQLIDRLIELQRKSGCNDYGRAPGPRLRPRDPKISNWPCPQGHSSKVYCEKWLKIRKLPEVNKINIQPGRSYKNIIKELERMV